MNKRSTIGEKGLSGNIMLKEIGNALKVSIHLKDLLLWFAGSFAIMCILFLGVYGRSADMNFLTETLGYAVVFVLLMAGTKSYSHFIDVYQSSNRHHRRA